MIKIVEVVEGLGSIKDDGYETRQEAIDMIKRVYPNTFTNEHKRQLMEEGTTTITIKNRKRVITLFEYD